MSDSFNMINVPGDNPEFKDLYVFHGKSAYQAAVEYGFEGTEEEWVETMKALIFGQMETFDKKNPNLIYIDIIKNNIYRYDSENDQYIPIGGVLGETEDTAYRGDRGKIAYDHSQSEHVALDHHHNASDIDDFNDQRLDVKVVDVATGTDLNTITNPNRYRGDHVSDIINAPIENSTRFKLEVYDGGNDTRIQIYVGEDNLFYYRVIQLVDDVYESTLLDWRLSGAVYEHPDTHPASMIEEDSTHRFTTDEEKENWNSTEERANQHTDSKIDELVGDAPDDLNTIDKLAAAIGDDPNFATTMDEKISDTLSESKTYAEQVGSYVGSQAKTYIDNALSEASTNIDTRFANTKTYIDTGLANVKTYVDEADANILSEAKKYADAQYSLLTNAAPELLNTLDELAAALGDDPNFATTMTNELSKKANSEQVAKDIDTALASAKAYADSQDVILLDSAKSYSDNNLKTAKAYADQAEADALAAAKTYSDTNLATAKAYADTAEADALSAAKTYTDNTVAKYLPLAGGKKITGNISFGDVSLYPETTNTGYLGTASYKWKGVYATTFYGALSGTASYANYLNIVNSNEIRFGNKPSSAVTLHIGWKWADGTGAALISNYQFNDGNGGLTDVYAKTFVGALSGNATSATKATKDSADQQINTTYIKGLSNSNNIITYTKGDGTTGTLTMPTYNYTLPVAGTALGGVKSGGDITVDSSGTISVKDDSHSHSKVLVADLRDAEFAPSNFSAKTMTTLFRQTDMPVSGKWYSGISIAGWTTDYNQWQLVGRSHNEDSDTSLYFRNGRSSTWQAWREILDSVNYGNYALPLSGGKKITGSVSFGDVKLYPESNSTGSLGDSTHVWYNIYSTNATINNITATTLKTNGYIFGYRYSQGNDLPAFVFDKPGSNYTGIGACGSSDTIYFSAVNSDGMTWNKTYKQKWLFNGTVSADSYSNDPLMPFQVKTALNFVNRGIAWDANSYYEHVILLLPVLTATNWYGLNYIDGKFLCWKEGGNVYDVIEVNMNHVYNALEYNIESYGQNGIWELCRCEYNGVDYYALKCPYHANPYTRVEFTGKIISALTGGTDTVALPLDVAYYNQNTSTVLNSEVNSSLTTTLTTSIVTSVNHRAKTLTGGINLVSKVQTGADQSGNAVYGSMYNTITGVSISMNGISISGGTSGGIITANNQIISNNVMSTKEFYASKKIVLTETGNILLRPSSSSYTAGIGYDTSGNECIALWAKNTVTRLRWYAGTDMSTLTAGTMMGITPDFEISKASGTAKGYIGGKEIITTETNGTVNTATYAQSLYKSVSFTDSKNNAATTGIVSMNIISTNLYNGDSTTKVCGVKLEVWNRPNTLYSHYLGPFTVGVSDLSPAWASTSDLGTSSYKWKNVYCSAGAFNGSDRKIKKDITYDIDKRYISLFDNLKICTFKYKAGTSGRTHVGVIAQDLLETMEELNLNSKDFAGVAYDISRNQETNSERKYYDLYCGFDNAFYEEYTGKINNKRENNKREILTYDVHYRDSVSIFDRDQRFLIIKTDADPEDYKKINEEYPDLTIHSIKLTSNDENVEDYIINLHNHIAYDPEYHSVEFEYTKDGSLHIIPKERYDGIGIALREDRELIDLSMYDNIVIDITYSDEFILGANYHEYDIYHEMSEEERRIYMVRWGEIAALNVMKTQEHTKRIAELEDEVRELKATINDLISIIKNNNLMS